MVHTFDLLKDLSHHDLRWIIILKHRQINRRLWCHIWCEKNFLQVITTNRNFTDHLTQPFVAAEVLMCFLNKQNSPHKPCINQGAKGQKVMWGMGVDYSDDCFWVWQLGGLQGACDVKTFHHYQGPYQDNVFKTFLSWWQWHQLSMMACDWLVKAHHLESLFLHSKDLLYTKVYTQMHTYVWNQVFSHTWWHSDTLSDRIQRHNIACVLH